MGYKAISKKTKTNQNTTSTYGWQSPPDTAETTALQNDINQGESADPSIQYDYANRKKNLNQSLASPFGANYSPETSEAMKYARGSEIDTEHGQALQEDSFRRKQSRFNKLYALAGIKAPRMVQTGGTMQGSVTTPIWQDMLMSGISTGIGAAAGAI